MDLLHVGKTRTLTLGKEMDNRLVCQFGSVLIWILRYLGIMTSELLYGGKRHSLLRCSIRSFCSCLVVAASLLANESAPINSAVIWSSGDPARFLSFSLAASNSNIPARSLAFAPSVLALATSARNDSARVLSSAIFLSESRRAKSDASSICLIRTLASDSTVAIRTFPATVMASWTLFPDFQTSQLRKASSRAVNTRTTKYTINILVFDLDAWSIDGEADWIIAAVIIVGLVGVVIIALVGIVGAIKRRTYIVWHSAPHNPTRARDNRSLQRRPFPIPGLILIVIVTIAVIMITVLVFGRG